MIWYSLKDLLPPIYRAIKSIFETAETENIELQKAVEDAEKVLANFFVQTCDESTLSHLEWLLGITPFDISNIDIRREDVLSAMNNATRFTMPFLIEQLNIIFGKGGFYQTYCEDKYTQSMPLKYGRVLHIHLRNPFADTIHRLNFLLNRILPCHVQRDIVGGLYPERLDLNPNVACMCGVSYSATCLQHSIPIQRGVK